ncbi:MAG: hypothetical protein COT73_11470, partial [Bdellovibrio sp. CG10_big_fil_rev_8_21_14_0_10_47_8]
YPLGGVIFVPAAGGLNLGNGRIHNGFFVIRDSGGGIKGKGRFDFFTGLYSDTSKKNPFRQLNLGDRNSRMPFYLVKGDLARRVLRDRAYPELPAANKQATATAASAVAK